MEEDRDCGLVRVSLEGNIGVGKSTILHLLQTDPRLQEVLEVLEESIESWQKVKGDGLNMLRAYEEPERYAYLFQSFVFITRFLQHTSEACKSKPALLLTERSVSTDRIVFVEALVEHGYLNELEAAAYEAWYDAVVTALPNVLADCFIYLRASPKVCHERLKTRGKSKEAGVGLDYLECLHQKHENWLLEGTSPLIGQDSHQPDVGKDKTSLRISRNSTLACMQGRRVLVVDCSSNLNMSEQSPERDAILDQIDGTEQVREKLINLLLIHKGRY